MNPMTSDHNADIFVDIIDKVEMENKVEYKLFKLFNTEPEENSKEKGVTEA